MFSQIWKDITYNTTGDTFDFKICDESDNILYKGSARAFPDGGIRIPINKICSRYLNTSLTINSAMTDNLIHHSDAYREFKLKNKNNGLEIAYNLLNDWSYEEEYEDRTLSEPINGHLDSRMKLLYTVFKSNGGTICYGDWYFNYTPSRFVFSGEASYATVKVTSTVPYTAASMNNWLRITPASGGVGEKIFTVSVDAQASTADPIREGIITFTIDEDNVFTLPVRQNKKEEGYAKANRKLLVFTQNRETQRISITSDIDYTLYIFEGDNWINLSSTSGTTGTTEFSITAAEWSDEYTGEYEKNLRWGAVYIKNRYNDIVDSFDIIQREVENVPSNELHYRKVNSTLPTLETGDLPAGLEIVSHTLNGRDRAGLYKGVVRFNKPITESFFLFGDRNIRNLFVPNTVTVFNSFDRLFGTFRLSQYAYAGDDLDYFDFPNATRSIYCPIFHYPENRTDITLSYVSIPDSVENLWSFDDSSDTNYFPMFSFPDYLTHKFYDYEDGIFYAGNMAVFAFREQPTYKIRQGTKFIDGLFRTPYDATIEVTSVDLPSSIEKVGPYAFDNMTSGVTLDFSHTGLKEFYTGAFGEVRHIILPNTLEKFNDVLNYHPTHSHIITVQYDYMGTMTEWGNVIKLRSDWNQYHPVIHCTDGDITT